MTTAENDLFERMVEGFRTAIRDREAKELELLAELDALNGYVVC